MVNSLCVEFPSKPVVKLGEVLLSWLRRSSVGMRENKKFQVCFYHFTSGAVLELTCRKCPISGQFLINQPGKPAFKIVS